MKRFFVLLACAISLMMNFSSAQIPRTLSYQGLLNDNNGVPRPDGVYSFTFRFYTVASGGTPAWSETKSLQVKRGLFSTILGSNTAIPDAVTFDRQYWLGIQVAVEPEMLPRVELTSVGSSFSAIRAGVAETVPDNAITGAKIAAGQVVIGINNLHDNLTMEGANGASVTANGNTITITAPGGSGSGGIASLQNTDNAFSITNPAGPTTTVNLKSPLSLSGNMNVAGNVGIGTVNPTVKLDVSSSGGDLFHLSGYEPFLTLFDANHQSRRGVIQQVNGGLNLFTDSYLTGANLFAYMRLDNSGNVGIGTATPTATLEVASLGGDIFHLVGYEPYLTLYDANHGYSRGAIQQVNGGLNLFTDSYLTGVNLFAYMRLDNSGNVGIGTATPNAKLEVASGSGDIFHLVGYEPFLTLYDANHGYRRGVIQQVNGGLNMFTDSYLTGGNLTAYVRLDNSGNLGIGTATPTAKLEVVGHTKTQVLEITGGSDLAEPFDMKEDIEPGTVMSIDPENPGKLIASGMPYDQKVAGIVSGAGGVFPGLTLRQQGVLDGTHTVAIAGRVYCKAEALTEAIQPGDLLTTSPLTGYAMKATDRDLSHGSVIGKAMTPLRGGKGLVLVLVNLQ